ncbi:hypothetical protein MPSEU_000853400 [Mayamaea pseudoterrestris]|nr:hypothetical protein MPSEU_000853400 [Mayamaea pseudoterrestris]
MTVPSIVSRLVALFSLATTINASIISTSDARLPMSLSTIISDLEAEGCSEVSTFCLITSHGVTKERQERLLDALVGSSIKEHESAGAAVVKAAGTSSGLALGQPDEGEVALTACACGGKIVYYADPIDLARGEGLFDTLAPAMEKLLGTSLEQSKLIVIVNDESQVETVRSRLEKAAEPIIKTLISERPVSSLQEVFGQVVYVSQENASAMLSSEPSTNPADAMSKISELVSLETMLVSSSVSSSVLGSENLAAARILGPTARIVLQKAMAQVSQACQNEDGSVKLVSAFGELCNAVIQMALRELENEVKDCPSLLQSKVGKQIHSNLEAELFAELGDLFDTQLELLQAASTDEFKKAVSKLLVSPNLGKDMDALVEKTVSNFAKAAGKLLPKGSHQWSIQPAKQTLKSQLKEFCTNRLIMARAAGQYKPLPRKGVTVGLHWLLPKPFGNDYRQEPWMVHATDGMVYIPRDKITEVSPVEAGSGSWLNKLVPAPAANEMVYMQ